MAQHPARLLIVDDEPEVTDVLRDYFVARGFSVETAASAAAARRTLDSGSVDCVLLDVMLPDGSGFDICRGLRARSDLPVLFLTALNSDVDKLRGLGFGDDYIVKSASPAEVVARVNAVLRRLGPRRTLVEDGRLTIDLDARAVTIDGRPATLTRREFDLLQLLVTNPGRVLTHERVVAELWDGYADVATLWGYVRRLRAKLERDPSRPRHLATVWGVGYRWDP